MVKIQKTSKLAKLSVAVLLVSTSIASAQAPAAEHAPAVAPVPVAEPAPAPVAAPVPAPVAEPAPTPIVVSAPISVAAPIAAPAESAPAPKPSSELAMVTPGGTKVSLYGRLELNSFYEDNFGNSGVSSMFANIRKAEDKDNDKSYNSVNDCKNAKGKDCKEINPQGKTGLAVNRTRLGLNLEGPSKEGEPSIKGRFEADFSGNTEYNNFGGGASVSGSGSTNSSGAYSYSLTSVGQGFRIRQSWGSVNFKDMGLTLLFGQTDDLISPLDPPAVNPSSFNGAGNIGNRRPQIRVTEALGPIELAVAATQDRLYDDNNASSSPAMQGRLGLKLPATWAGEKSNMAVGIAGLFAKNEKSNANDDERDPRLPSTYTIAADLSLPLMDILTLTGEFFTGQNLRRYGDGSLSLSDTRVIDNVDKDGKKKAAEDIKSSDTTGVLSTGWWAGLALKLPANLSIGAAIGMENLSDDVVKVFEKTKSGDTRTGNMFIAGNLAYNFTSAAKLTFEYSNLATDYVKSIKDDDGKPKGDKTDASLNRYELNFRYDFK
jgi:hypothetical protein